MKNRFIVSLLFLSLLTTVVLPERLSAQPARPLRQLIQSLEVGQPIHHDNLTIMPIYTTARYQRHRYTTLDEALKRGWLSITEVDAGEVPKVRLTNTSRKQIYIMAGEIISGGKQDRIVAREVLLRPRARNVVVPVYCVEQGRWNYESENFYSKENLGTYKLRAVSQYDAVGAQSAVWESIAKDNARLGVRTTTGAYQAGYEQKGIRDKIIRQEEYFRDIPHLHPDTIGVAVGVAGRIVSVDIFENPELFQELWPKILKSSAMASLNSSREGYVNEQDAVRFLRNLYNIQYTRKTALDLGEEYTSYDYRANVNALVFDQAVVHLSAFSEEGKVHNYQRSNDYDRRIPVMRR